MRYTPWVLAVNAAALTCEYSVLGGAKVALIDIVVDLPQSLAAGLTDFEGPFALTIGAKYPLYPDGVTLTAPLPKSAYKTMEKIAPSQYQRNWQNTGGVIDGGPNVELWNTFILNELLEPGWVQVGLSKSEFSRSLPSVPVDLSAALMIKDGYEYLPSFAGKLAEIPLREMEYPFYQVYRYEWNDHNPEVNGKRMKSGFNQMLYGNKTDPSGFLLRLRDELDAVILGAQIHKDAKLPSATFTTHWMVPVGNGSYNKYLDQCSTNQVGFVKTVRRAASTGLTSKLTSGYQLQRAENFASRHCTLEVTEVWPRTLFIDQDEARAHFDSYSASLSPEEGIAPSKWTFPHFHEIELPAHLAAPAIFGYSFELPATTKLETIWNRSGKVPLHSRYRIERKPDLSARPGSVTIPNPKLNLRCPPNPRPIPLHFLQEPPVVDVTSITVDMKHLRFVSRTNTMISGLAVSCVLFIIWLSWGKGKQHVE